MRATREVAADASGETSIGADRAQLELPGTGEVLLDREARSARFRLSRPLDDAELIHPMLAPVGAVFAWWRGLEAIHAGAFVVEGGCWALVGDREDGKSTTLAWLAGAGCAVLSDDLVVLRDGIALAGPRCIDLRPEAARVLERERGASVVRSGTRRRVALGAAPAEIPLAGVVFCAWAGDCGMVRVPPAERLPRWSGNRAVRLAPQDPVALLDLATLPAWEWRRPRSWNRMGEAVERLLAVVGA